MATVVNVVTEAAKAPLAPKNRSTVIIIVAIAIAVWWFFFRGRRAGAGTGEEDFAPVIGGGGGGSSGGGIDTPLNDFKDRLSETQGDPGSIGVPLDPRFLGELKDAVIEPVMGNGGLFSAGDTGGASGSFGFSSGQLSFIQNLQAARNTSTLGDPVTLPPPVAPPKESVSGALDFSGGGGF